MIAQEVLEVTKKHRKTYKPQVVCFNAKDNVFARRTELKGDKYTIAPPKLNIIWTPLVACKVTVSVTVTDVSCDITSYFFLFFCFVYH